MPVRNIVHIDETRCNGCGLCIPSCAEGAIQIVDGKARLVSDKYCDGLGACLGKCPQDAITIIQREAQEFDEEAAKEHVKGLAGAAITSGSEAAPGASHGPAAAHRSVPTACPASLAFERERGWQFPKGAGRPIANAAEGPAARVRGVGRRQWPVQLTLVPAKASYFEDADLAVVADCVAFACPDMHERFLQGRAVVVGCPKLDDGDYYVEKLAEIFRSNSVKSVSVVHMEVPCCFGLGRIVERALESARVSIPVDDITVGIDGTGGGG